MVEVFGMLLWLLENWGTILVAALVFLLVAVVVFVLVRDKRAGRCSCGSSSGGGCAGCAGCAAGCPNCSGIAKKHVR